MKHTKEQLEAMSDRGIDKLVAISTGFNADYIEKNPNDAPFYCSRWVDAGPLIDELKSYHGARLTISDNFVDFHSERTYPTSAAGEEKRAIAIVYILIRQGE